MTIENYTDASNQELADIIDVEMSKIGRPTKRSLRSHCPELYTELVRRTSFLDMDVQDTLPGRLYCLRNNVTETPRCSVCGSPVKWSNHRRGFHINCSFGCAAKDPNRLERMIETCRRKYNVDNPFQVKEIKERIRHTMVERYGVEHALQSESIMRKVQSTKLGNMGSDPHLKYREIMERVWRRRLNSQYGEEYVNEIMERTRFLDSTYDGSIPFKARIYCVEHNLTEQPRCQNPECPHNHPHVGWCTKTHEFHMYCSYACLQASPLTKSRIDSAFNSRYGGHPMKSMEIRERAVRNNKMKHGGIHSSSVPEVKAKVAATNMQRYGVTCSLQNDAIDAKARQSMLEHHGAEYPFQCKDIQERIRETLLKTKGVEHPSQTYEFHKNRRHKFKSMKYPGISFDSTWEVKVYEFCRDNGILVEYSPEISYKYEYDGKVHTYHPDFLINGRVYEVKGDHFFRTNESTGGEEMYCPYHDPKWSNDYYDWMCGQFEAKHQCMLANGVTILRQSDMEHLDSIFTKA